MRQDDAIRFEPVASFANSVEANIAAGALKENGFDAVVANADLADMAWHLTTALGGVKVLVPGDQHQEAREFLQQFNQSEKADNQTDAAEPSERRVIEKQIDRSVKAALLGLFFFPLNFYSFYLVIKTIDSGTVLRKKDLRKLLIATVVNLAILGTIGLLSMQSYMYPAEMLPEGLEAIEIEESITIPEFDSRVAGLWHSTTTIHTSPCKPQAKLCEHDVSRIEHVANDW